MIIKYKCYNCSNCIIKRKQRYFCKKCEKTFIPKRLKKNYNEVILKVIILEPLPSRYNFNDIFFN